MSETPVMDSEVVVGAQVREGYRAVAVEPN